MSARGSSVTCLCGDSRHVVNGGEGAARCGRTRDDNSKAGIQPPDMSTGRRILLNVDMHRCRRTCGVERGGAYNGLPPPPACSLIRLCIAVSHLLRVRLVVIARRSMFDRTADFIATVEWYRRQGASSVGEASGGNRGTHAPAGHGSPSPLPAAAAPVRRLPPRNGNYVTTRASALAAKSLARTIAKLLRLSTRRALFMDVSQEVNALAATTKAGLQALDAELTALAATAARMPSAARAGAPSVSNPAAVRTAMAAEGASAAPLATHGTRTNPFALDAPPLPAAAYTSSTGVHDVVITYDPSALNAPVDAVAARMATLPPQGSERSFWTAVFHILHDVSLNLARVSTEVMRLRSQAVAEASEHRKTLARSTWTPLISTDSPLFAQDAVTTYGSTSAADASSSRAAASGSNGVMGSRGGVPGGAGVLPTHEAADGTDAVSARRGLRRRPGLVAPTTAGSGVASPFALSSSAGMAAAAAPSHSVPGAAPGVAARGGALMQPSMGAHSGAAPRQLVTGPASYTAAQISRYHDASARASEMRQIESTIVELGHLFTRVASLVSDQGDVVQRIDADMTTAYVPNTSARVCAYARAPFLAFAHTVHVRACFVIAGWTTCPKRSVS